jgi:hypothetical protein
LMKLKKCNKMKNILILILFTGFVCKKNTSTNLNEIGRVNNVDLFKNDTTNISNKILVSDSINIDSITNQLLNLDKIKKANKNCKLSLLIKEPVSIDDDYELDLGINSDERFQTMFVFFYKKKENIILYYDTMKDEYIEISKWDKEILKIE